MQEFSGSIQIVVGMGYTRQSIALGIILYALPYLYQGKKWVFGVSIVFAALFHSPAIIFLALLLFLQNRRAFVFGFSSLAVLIVLGSILFSDVLLGRVDLYTGGELESKGAYVRLAVLLSAALLLLGRRRFYKEVFAPDCYKVLMASALAALALVILGMKFSTIADRYGVYLYYLQMSVFSRLPFQGGQVNFGYFFVVALHALMFAIWLFGSPYATDFWVPYRNILVN